MRLIFLSGDFLLDIMTNDLVRENLNCLKLISDAIKLTSFTREDLPQSPRKGLETRAIVACGGKYTFCYLPQKDNEWKRLADGLSERNHLTQMLSYRDHLNAFPSDGKAERYDPVVNSWCTLDLSTTRSTKVAVVRGEIYAIEVNPSMETVTVKRYDVERCSWQTVLSSPKGCREDYCVVAVGNHLYVCGGWLEDGFVTKAERFDTVENKWEEIANMQLEKGNAFGVASEGKIFVAGGQRGYWYTCEMFSISTNQWQFIGSLNFSREYGSMVCLKGTVYVLGGIRGYRRNLLSVECYEDKWIKNTTIPVKMISEDNKDTFTDCVLKLSKGVLDKLDVVKK